MLLHLVGFLASLHHPAPHLQVKDVEAICSTQLAMAWSRIAWSRRGSICVASSAILFFCFSPMLVCEITQVRVIDLLSSFMRLHVQLVGM